MPNPNDKDIRDYLVDALLMGTRVVPAIGGAVLGGGSTFGLGALAGGAAGGALGESLAQEIERYLGRREALDPKTIALTGALGAIPMGRVAQVGRLGRMAREAAKGGVIGAGSDIAFQATEQDTLRPQLDLGRTLLSTGMGGAFGSAGGIAARKIDRDALVNALTGPESQVGAVGADIGPLVDAARLEQLLKERLPQSLIAQEGVEAARDIRNRLSSPAAQKAAREGKTGTQSQHDAATKQLLGKLGRPPTSVEVTEQVAKNTASTLKRDPIPWRAFRAIFDTPLGQKLRVLDFGSGRKNANTVAQRELGFNVEAHDFNQDSMQRATEGGYRAQPETQYDVVVSANVMNVANQTEGLTGLAETIRTLNRRVTDDGMVIVNYPKAPRMMPEMSVGNLETLLRDQFESVTQVFVPKKVRGGRQPGLDANEFGDALQSVGEDAPLFILRRPRRRSLGRRVPARGYHLVDQEAGSYSELSPTGSPISGSIPSDAVESVEAILGRVPWEKGVSGPQPPPPAPFVPKRVFVDPHAIKEGAKPKSVGQRELFGKPLDAEEVPPESLWAQDIDRELQTHGLDPARAARLIQQRTRLLRQLEPEAEGFKNINQPGARPVKGAKTHAEYLSWKSNPKNNPSGKATVADLVDAVNNKERAGAPTIKLAGFLKDTTKAGSLTVQEVLEANPGIRDANQIIPMKTGVLLPQKHTINLPDNVAELRYKAGYHPFETKGGKKMKLPSQAEGDSLARKGMKGRFFYNMADQLTAEGGAPVFDKDLWRFFIRMQGALAPKMSPRQALAWSMDALERYRAGLPIDDLLMQSQAKNVKRIIESLEMPMQWRLRPKTDPNYKPMLTDEKPLKIFSYDESLLKQLDSFKRGEEPVVLDSWMLSFYGMRDEPGYQGWGTGKGSIDHVARYNFLEQDLRKKAKKFRMQDEQGVELYPEGMDVDQYQAAIWAGLQGGDRPDTIGRAFSEAYGQPSIFGDTLTVSATGDAPIPGRGLGGRTPRAQSRYLPETSQDLGSRVGSGKGAVGKTPGNIIETNRIGGIFVQEDVDAARRMLDQMPESVIDAPATSVFHLGSNTNITADPDLYAIDVGKWKKSSDRLRLGEITEEKWLAEHATSEQKVKFEKGLRGQPPLLGSDTTTFVKFDHRPTEIDTLRFFADNHRKLLGSQRTPFAVRAHFDPQEKLWSLNVVRLFEASDLKNAITYAKDVKSPIRNLFTDEVLTPQALTKQVKGT